MPWLVAECNDCIMSPVVWYDKRMKYIIVAYDRNHLIGGANRLLWEGDMRSDMRRVRALTTGNAIIMGRRTYESIGRPLPNRQNIVVTHRAIETEGVATADSLQKAFEIVEPGREAYVFGGGQIYEQALSFVDRVLATEIDAEFEGDTFFPILGDDWTEAEREDHPADEENLYPFSFVTYIRR